MMATEDYTAYRVYCEHFCLQFALRTFLEQPRMAPQALVAQNR